MRVDKKTAGTIVLLALCLMGMDNADNGEGERVKLLDQRKQLSVKAENLKREQDFLVFQKEAVSVDSKYLILDSGSRTGKLKYKNRVLKNFSFATPKAGRAASPGRRVLTEKLDGAENRHRLVFGKTLVIAPKGSPALSKEKHKARLLLGKRDFTSIYYALESGSLVYIVK